MLPPSGRFSPEDPGTSTSSKLSVGLPGTQMRIRRRRQNIVARLFTELPADVFRHAIGFWRSDRDPPVDSDEDD